MLIYSEKDQFSPKWIYCMQTSLVHSDAICCSFWSISLLCVLWELDDIFLANMIGVTGTKLPNPFVNPALLSRGEIDSLVAAFYDCTHKSLIMWLFPYRVHVKFMFAVFLHSSDDSNKTI